MLTPGRHFLPRRKKRKKSETMIQNLIRDWLQANGFYVIRHQQGLGCHPGLSDLTAMKDGFTIWIEVKAAKGKLSEAQENFATEIISHGCHYIVPQSIEDVESYPPIKKYIITNRLL